MTKHLAAFLAANDIVGRPPEAPAEGAGERALHVMFNGGVFKAETLRYRVLDALETWCRGSCTAKLLEGYTDLDRSKIETLALPRRARNDPSKLMPRPSKDRLFGPELPRIPARAFPNTLAAIALRRWD